jgi:transposase
MVNLALFHSVLPAAPIDQLREFLHSMNPVGVPFGPQAIIRAKQLLNFSRKASSTNCLRAFLPVNEHKRRLLWTHNYPFGRQNVRTQEGLITGAGAGHRYLFRAPYWSVDGPIEYVFNTIHTHLLSYFT